MKVTIHPSTINGNITAPASKSSMQRACAAALLRKGASVLQNPGSSNDDIAALEIIEKLGATINLKDGNLEINSSGLIPVSNELNCGESGLSIRMFTPIAALSNQEITISGEGSLASRPMDFFDEVLPQLGVSVKTANGKLPIVIKGPLIPANIDIDGSLSSQFLTGLLMAFSAANRNEKVTIRVKDLKSKPYVDLTLDVMKKFGLDVPENLNYEEFVFSASSSSSLQDEVRYTVEGDWSGAAFLLVGGAIAGPITVTGLDLTSNQADKAIIDALMSANAAMAIEAKGIKIHPGKMNAFDFDATDCPDLFPPLVSLACYCQGLSHIKGVSRLTHKESNRALTLQDEFDKMGVRIDLDGDMMTIYGGGKVKGADIHSHHDHRIAMACAIAALNGDSETVIEEAFAIKKSYPGFYNDLKSLGADVSLPWSIDNRY